jgi:Eukaryotic mitochondrial regulator protein
MYQWLKGREGSELAEAKGGPRYLGPLQDQPFPLNPLFRSQPVLDETTRELIWDKVIMRGEALKAVSAEMGVDVRRVAAVVRLKEVEKQWEREVSLYPCCCFFVCFALRECVLRDETISKIRLVLKTLFMVRNDLYDLILHTNL